MAVAGAGTFIENGREDQLIDPVPTCPQKPEGKVALLILIKGCVMMNSV